MDSKGNEFLRKALLKESHLVSAIRLPNNLFANTGGIEVQSDLIVLQKDLNRSKNLTANEKLFLSSGEIINDYYQNLKHVVHTRGSFDTNQFGELKSNHYHDGSEQCISSVKLQLKVYH